MKNGRWSGVMKTLWRPARAAAAGDRRRGVHLVDVRSLLAVDHDADEVGVEQRRDLGIREGLAFHHVAPMAGREPDGEKDELSLPPGLVERCLAPRMPVDRVAGVLEQVRARLEDEPVVVGPSVGWKGRDDRCRWQDATPVRVTLLRRGHGRQEQHGTRGRDDSPGRLEPGHEKDYHTDRLPAVPGGGPAAFVRRRSASAVCDGPVATPAFSGRPLPFG